MSTIALSRPETEWTPPPEPERPPVGHDHVRSWEEELPPVPPITSPGNSRHTLIVGSTQILTQERTRDWLLRLRASRAKNPAARASDANINVVVDATQDVRLLAKPEGRKTHVPHRDVFRPKSDTERLWITSSHSSARQRVSEFFAHVSVPSDRYIGFGILVNEITFHSGVPTVRGTQTVLPAETFARLAAGDYDEVIYLCAESRLPYFRRKYGREPRSWVIWFPD